MKKRYWMLGVVVGAFALTVYVNMPEQVKARQLAETQRVEAEVESLATANTLYLKPADANLMPYLKNGAKLILLSGECQTIYNGSRSSNAPGKTDPKFYYQCNDPNKVSGRAYLTVSQIKAGGPVKVGE